MVFLCLHPEPLSTLSGQSHYSPDFNPIEMAWSKLKAYLRKVAARTSATLDKAIAQGWHAVSADDARGYC